MAVETADEVEGITLSWPNIPGGKQAAEIIHSLVRELEISRNLLKLAYAKAREHGLTHATTERWLKRWEVEKRTI